MSYSLLEHQDSSLHIAVLGGGGGCLGTVVTCSNASPHLFRLCTRFPSSDGARFSLQGNCQFTHLAFWCAHGRASGWNNYCCALMTWVDRCRCHARHDPCGTRTLALAIGSASFVSSAMLSPLIHADCKMAAGTDIGKILHHCICMRQKVNLGKHLLWPLTSHTYTSTCQHCLVISNKWSHHIVAADARP